MRRLAFRLRWALALIAALACGVVLGVYLGLDLSVRLEREFSTPSRLLGRLDRGYGAVFLQDTPRQSTVATNRLRLSVTEHYLPLQLRSGGGGMTADGTGGLLIVDPEGKLFRFRDGRAAHLPVVTPDRRADALRRQLDAGRLGDIEINFGQVRFNDVLIHATDQDSWLVLSYTEWHPDAGCFTSTLARAALPSPDPATWRHGPDDWQTVVRSRPCLVPFRTGFGIRGAEAGGRLVSGPGTSVYWTVGAYHRDDEIDKARPETALAQGEDNDYGKVLQVDIATAAVTHVARGLRNPQGIDLGPDGVPLVTDHGMRGGDEVNRAVPGANFGFPLVTLGTRYSGEAGGLRPFHTGHDGFDRPLVAFTPAIAPSSLLFVRDFHPDWNGSLLVGGLRRQLHRIYLEDGVVLLVEPMDLGFRIRDMAWTGDGRLALLTDDKKLVLIAPDAGASPHARLVAALDAEPDAHIGQAARGTLAACLQCHALEPDESGTGPSLHRVCGRKPGGVRFARYSGALDRLAAPWGEETLAAFLADPEAVAPGTTMTTRVERAEVARALARALCATD